MVVFVFVGATVGAVVDRCGVGVGVGGGCMGVGSGVSVSAVGEEVGARRAGQSSMKSCQTPVRVRLFLETPGSATSHSSHGTHTDDPGGAMVDDAHGVHDDAPAAAENVPNGQMLHGAPAVA